MGAMMSERKRRKRLANEITGEADDMDTDTVPDTNTNMVGDMDSDTDKGVDSDGAARTWE